VSGFARITDMHRHNRQTRSTAVSDNTVDRPPGKLVCSFYDLLRNSQATLQGVPHAPSDSVLYLVGARCLLLESECANGDAVAIPVCFAAINEKIFVRTEAGSAQVRRLERWPVVKVAACTFRGTPVNDYIECIARIVPTEREPEAEASLRRQYGMIRRLYDRLMRSQHAYLELTPRTADKLVPDDKALAAAVKAINRRRHERPPGAA
jgi:PPOX class probable F420-dependent enzyme